MSAREIDLGAIVNVTSRGHLDERGSVSGLGPGDTVHVYLDGDREATSFRRDELRLVWTGDEERARAELVRAGWRLTPPPPEEPPRKCSANGCEETEETDMAGLTEVTVEVARGEEGHSWIVRRYCDEHLAGAQDDLTGMGFKSHRHGGINYLEDQECPGARDMDKCPVYTREYMYDVGVGEAEEG